MQARPCRASGRCSRAASTRCCSAARSRIVGVGLVTLFSAADQSVAARHEPAGELRLRDRADVAVRQHSAADARARGGAALRRRRADAGRRRAVRRRRQRLAPLAQPRRRALPAVRAHEDRAAADARVVLPEVRGPHRLEGLRARRGADRRAGLPDQAAARPRHGAADRARRASTCCILAGLSWKVIVGLVGARRGRRSRSCGRTCTTTSASAS